MKEIGLQPSDTGENGGKETGQKVSHYILDGGKFDKSFAKLEATGLKLKWESKGGKVTVRTARAKGESKLKYSCVNCGLNSWAKPDAKLLCGVCSNEGELVDMVAE